MLIYEKYVEEEKNGENVMVRHLFGTMGNIPANDDVQLTYKDNDGDIITVEPTDSYVDGGSKEGVQFINRLYTEDEEAKSEKLNVFIGDTCVVGEVEEKELTKIQISTKPTKKEYIVNETLDLTGMIVKAVYADGDKETLESTDYTTSPADGDVLDTAGEVTVTVTYETKTASFKVTVSESQE